MDWAKVVKALDDEWFSRTQRADQLPTGPDRDRLMMTGHIAFMLRDVLTVGLTEFDGR